MRAVILICILGLAAAEIKRRPGKPKGKYYILTSLQLWKIIQGHTKLGRFLPRRPGLKIL